MTRKDYARLLIECGAVEVRPDPETWFTWRSGVRAPIYCDNRLLISYPDARSKVADGLSDAIRTGFPDVEVVAGPATAGIPFAAWVAERLQLPMVYVRDAPKGHGRQRRVEGRPLAGERVVVVEDLISYATSSASAVEGVAGEGGKVIGLQAVFTYALPAAAERLAALGVRWQALTDYPTTIGVMELAPSEAATLLEWRGS